MNRKGTGLVHIYFGDGKGKTTTGMGLCVRAAGYGYRVLIYQFMKNNKTSERNILEKIENVSIVNGLDQEKFSFQMTEQEKKDRLAFYNSQFEKVTKKAVEEDFDKAIDRAFAVGMKKEEVAELVSLLLEEK